MLLPSCRTHGVMSSSTTPLLAGFAAGVVSTTLLLPIDVVKVRLQVTTRRLGFGSALRGILLHEGWRGLWVGWTPAVLGSAVSWGGYFYFYEGLKKQMVEFKGGQDTSILTSVDNFGLACTAGGLMVLITNPIWLVKTRMQLQMKRASEKHEIKPYRHMVDAFRTIARDEGALALYRGVGPAMLLTTHGGVQFVVYEYLRKHFHVNKAQRSAQDSVLDFLEKSIGYLAMGAVAKM